MKRKYLEPFLEVVCTDYDVITSSIGGGDDPVFLEPGDNVGAIDTTYMPWRN